MDDPRDIQGEAFMEAIDPLQHVRLRQEPSFETRDAVSRPS